MRLKNQQGAAAIFIVLLAVTLVIAGLAFYRTQQSKSQVTNTAQPAPVSPSPSPQTSTPESATDAYLHIKEFGVKVKLTPEIADLVYYSQSGQPTQVKLSSKSIAEKSGGSCAVGPGVGPLGSLNRSKTYPSNLGPEGVKQIGGYYYYRTGPQAVCSEDPAVIALIDKQAGALIQALRNTLQAE
jgi:hypothetical protein